MNKKCFKCNYVLVLFCYVFFLLPNVQCQPRNFKIGLTAPLSGDLASIGQEMVRGLELGINDFSNNELKFEIITEDDQFQRKNALTSARKLIEINKVNAIISLWDMSEIVAPVAEEHQIPHFAIRWNPHVAEKYSYTMTVESTYRSWIDSLVKLLKIQKIKSVALIVEESEGWLLGRDRLKKLLVENEIRLIAETSYIRSDLDQKSIVQKLLLKKPEMVLLFSNPPNLEIFIQKIKEVKPNQLFGGYFEILDKPAIAEGMPFVAQLQPEPWFVEKYEASYKTPIKSRAPQSYDIVGLLADALKGNNYIIDGGKIVSHISQIKDFKGASGALNAKRTRTIEMDCVWKVAREGRFEIYK